MRKTLDFIYRGSGALAALFLLAICSIVALQVGANLIDAVAAWVIGEPIGLVVPSYAEFAGFFLAASSFLALAYTLRAGGHIRVSLIIRRFTGSPRRGIELWCTGAGGMLAGYLAFYAVRLVFDSIEFGDVSPGMVSVALWIPQSAVALGLVILTIALADEFVAALKGRAPSYTAKGEDDHRTGADGAPDEASLIER